MEATNASSLRALASKHLADAGSSLPHLEADWIICHAAGVSRASLHAHPEMTVEGGLAELIASLVARRAAGEPMAYITGISTFCGRELRTDRRALIPRTETEILTAAADGYMKKIPGAGVFADWCSGSGCIAVTLLEDNPAWRAFAVDSSREALALAADNAELRGVRGKITFVECSNPAECVDVIPLESLDLIVSNPPYVPKPDILTLESQVRGYEPVVALDGGSDGLDVCRLLLRELPRFMKKGAPLLLETGGERQVRALSSDGSGQGGLELSSIFEDHRGIERFVVWLKSE
ncbi:MAG: peptide chain release factor N(5)-glutamine methyltransferase [Synergistaceae bacterium]|nr:peptide chain release factor N(5)-glutamine methyltransferase [Synergistaceae bacterium]